MNTQKDVITFSNKRIVDYYNTNPNINIESMNLILLDFMEQQVYVMYIKTCFQILCVSIVK